MARVNELRDGLKEARQKVWRLMNVDRHMDGIMGIHEHAVIDVHFRGTFPSMEAVHEQFGDIDMRDYLEGLMNGSALKVEKVIFNEPATIVLWQDGTKTVVKASPDEPFDPEKGLAMAISKKALGNKGNYYNVFKKHLEEYEEKEEISSEPMKALDELAKLLRGGQKK